MRLFYIGASAAVLLVTVSVIAESSRPEIEATAIYFEKGSCDLPEHELQKIKAHIPFVGQGEGRGIGISTRMKTVDKAMAVVEDLDHCRTMKVYDAYVNAGIVKNKIIVEALARTLIKPDTVIVRDVPGKDAPK
ncbi:MAG: hypothetical protein EOP06_03025 [Proteobacteria bacterium]|nr:MAG: hypothetical protein EOP06_03025 [Pseudomonadota bacterium]